MKLEKKEIVFERYATPDALPAPELALLRDAMAAAGSAYAPYSNYRVGAAVLLADGAVVTGNNQENAAFPSGLCAERVALFHAAATHPGVAVKAIAVAAFPGGASKPAAASPCGGCRQVFSEYEYRYGSKIRVLMIGEAGAVVVAPEVGSLLPYGFDARNMPKRGS